MAAQRAAIVAGTVDTRPFLYPAVVHAGGTTCSGTLIDANHVLTAAHCVQDAQGSVVFEVDSADGPRTITVASCTIHPHYAELNRTCVKPEFDDPHLLPTLLNDRGAACGIFLPSRSCSPTDLDASSDVAVLQLARPIPRAALAPSSPGPAGEIFVDSIDLFDGLPTLPDLAGSVAVGSARVARRYGPAMPTSVNQTELYFFSIVDGSAPLLEEGDSGGPLFTAESPPRLVGVAHAIEVSSRGRVVGSEWTLVATGTRVGDWVVAMLDRDADGRSDTACGADLVRGLNPAASALSDPDGDGYLDAEEDTCPGVYNPCQLATDVDADGRPDDCDACPADPDIATARGQDPSDLDGDGLVGACDCQPDRYDDTLLDLDRDSAFDNCDNCPGVSNPDQSNRDGDTWGDLCDACPDDLNTGLDLDRDGVDDTCDNCPLLVAGSAASPWYNPLQENCNLEAEQAAGQRARGDLCDDTPCGETRLGTTRSEEILPSGRQGVVERMNLVEVDGRSTRAQPARTGFRFCPCSAAEVDDVETREICKTPQFDRTGSCEIGANGEYHQLTEQREHHWRQMVMNYPVGTYTFGSEPREEALIDYRPSVEGEFHDNLQAEWQLDIDRFRWERVFGAGSTASPELPGVLWTHTPGSVDASGAPMDFPPGLKALTSHYWSGIVAAPTEAPSPFPCLHYVGPYLSNAGCVFCAPAFPAPFLALPGLPGLGCGAPFEPPVLAIPDLPFDLGPLLPVDPALLARPDLRWLAPSEPVEWLPEGGTRLLALDSKLQTTVRLVDTGHGLGLPGGQGEPGCPNPNGCDPIDPLSFTASARSASVRASDPAMLVLSARQEIFWQLEGDARTGRGRVVAHPLDPTRLYHVDQLALGRVLAATYRSQDQALYVLDELTRGRGWRARSQVRLLRIDVSGALSMEIVATWPRRSNNTRYALVAAPGAGLWLAASAEPGVGPSTHVVVRLKPAPAEVRGEDDEEERDDHHDTPRWRVSAWAVGDGTLAPVQPRADARGLSLVVERESQEQALGYAQGDLWSVPGRDDHARLHGRGLAPVRHDDWDARQCF